MRVISDVNGENSHRSQPMPGAPMSASPNPSSHVGPWRAMGLFPISHRVGYRSFTSIYRAEGKKVEALGCRKSKRLLAS
jgi:hypothetical protein